MSCQTQSTVLPTSALRKPAGCYSETRSRSNGNWCVSILKDTNVIKLTFGYKSWLYLLDMTQSGCFWCLWPKMLFKMSQEFPTTSLNITKLSSSFFFFFFCGMHENSVPVSIDQSDVVKKTPKAIGTNHGTLCARGNCKFIHFWSGSHSLYVFSFTIIVMFSVYSLLSSA